KQLGNFSLVNLLRGCIPFIFAGILAVPAFAASSIIGEIVIKGPKKIESAAVRGKLASKVGDSVDRVTIRKDVEQLFATGFFNDVRVEQLDKNGKAVLVYTVVEKPSIASISYEGNDELSDDDISEVAELKAFEILDMSRLRVASEKIEKLYEDKGFFLARVKVRVEDDSESDNVRVIFDIVENDKVMVKSIRFLGNRQLPSGNLQGAMETKEGGFFSAIFGGGAYKQDAFDRDVQRLNFLYFNEGFVQVKIDRPQVYVTPDKKGIYITIRVEEGDRFNIGSVDFAGDMLFTHDELREATLVQEGDQFTYEDLQKDLRSLQAKYGDLGYAFTNVIPRTRVREKDQLVDITYEIDKGQKVFIGEINVVGNTTTRDKVVRRELRIREGELYNETRKRESLANVQRLGYFDEVNFNVKTPKGRSDIMDIDIMVKERNTGSIQLGAGYSSQNGMVVNGQIQQINLAGRGQKLSATLDYNKNQTRFNLNFTEPYLLDTEWSVGVDAYQSERVLIDYNEQKRGGALRVGHPLAPYLDGYLSYKLDDTFLELTSGDPALFPVDTANGITSSLTASLVYDKRNDRFAPTDGVYSNVSVEYAGLGGDLNYTKGGANFRYYKTVFWELVWRNNITYGFISSNLDNLAPPFNQLYLLGGPNTLRGYDWFTVGKRKFSKAAKDEAASVVPGLTDEEIQNRAMRPFGGSQQLYYNMEFQFPLIKEAGVMGVTFLDVGDAQDQLNLGQLRSDLGFGFRWFSPIGPLRFEWGFPLDRREEFDDPPYKFEFAIGSPF
ncbi:MAG: outer membrane protein assembly factor BamA, partial [Bdellovibrionales bacterium]|nr:outer membrane protein assembly factor BamA [Bdellovibrionales bacterium]